MTGLQRSIVILYCLLVVYCCVWIPWRIQVHTPSEWQRPSGYYRAGYGWSWVGPRNPQSLRYDSSYAAPDMPLIQLRIVAVTSIAAGGFVFSGMLAKSAPRRQTLLNLSACRVPNVRTSRDPSFAQGPVEHLGG
jgi:hypothetical protein